MTLNVSYILAHYGYIGVFVVLFLEVVGVPSVAEAILVTAGIQVERGVWLFVPLFLSAVAGNVLGAVLAYLFGRSLGRPAILKVGGKIGLTDVRMRQAEAAFKRYGLPIIFVGKWIPGIQVCIPYLAGIYRMRFQRFFLYNLFGTILWITVFLFLGTGLSRLLRKNGHWLLQHPLLGGAWLLCCLSVGMLLWTHRHVLPWYRKQ